MIELSVRGKLFNCHLLSEVAGLFFSDCGHQAIKVHHLALDPISDMLERVLELSSQEVQLVFKMGLGVTRDKLHVGVRIILDSSLLLVTFFVFLEKLSKLFIILKFLLLHRDNLVDVCLEILQVVD